MSSQDADRVECDEEEFLRWRLLSAVRHFLVGFFGYTTEDASGMVSRHFQGGVWPDLDAFHHYGPYTSAAIVHYLHGEFGAKERLETWLREGGFYEPPQDAVRYWHWLLANSAMSQCSSG